MATSNTIPRLTRKLCVAFALICVCVGCQTTNNSIITVTEVVDSAMKSWARASNSGQTSPEFDARVISAHDRYRQSAATAQAFLILYRDTSNQRDLAAALQAARNGAMPIVDMVVTLLSPTKAVELRTNLAKASAP